MKEHVRSHKYPRFMGIFCFLFLLLLLSCFQIDRFHQLFQEDMDHFHFYMGKRGGKKYMIGKMLMIHDVDVFGGAFEERVSIISQSTGRKE